MKAVVPPGGSEIALAALVWGVGAVTLIAAGPGQSLAGTLAVALAQGLAVLLRPTARTAAALAMAATLPLAFAIGAVAGVVGWTAFAFLAGRRGGGQVVGAAYAVAFAVAYGVLLLRYGPAEFADWPLFGAVLFGVAPLLAWGLGRWRRAARARERRRLSAEEAVRVADALAAERGRIADDLGAVVLGELRHVAGLAAGLRQAVAAGPSEPALAELQQSARRALTAMRRVLTVLRAADADPGPVRAVPPRRWWEPGRPDGSGIVLAAVLATLVLLSGAFHTALDGGATDGYFDLPLDRPWLLAALAVEVGATAWWRSGPVPALAVATAGSFVLNLADATHFVGESSWLILVYAAGSWAVPRVSGPAVLACSAVVALEFTMLPRPLPLTPLQALLSWLQVPALWGVGLAVRAIRLRAGRARAVAEEHRLRTRLGDERHRIARDLHDLVAHHCSAVAVQASAARAAPATLPEALDHIEESGRRIADAARDLADLAPPAPVPPLTREVLEGAVGPLRAAGLPVSVEVEGEPPGEPGEAELFAHRILGEALTNVLRHAGPSPTRVLVRHTEGAVELEVGDGGPVPGHRPTTLGSGLGLVGMRERAALLGGEATVGPGAGGWWVRAHLPRAAPPRAPVALTPGGPALPDGAAPSAPR